MNKPSIGTHSIILHKFKEDNEFVWYKFEVSVMFELDETDNRGRVIRKFEPRYGLIKFQKSGELKNATYEIIEAETDTLILADAGFEHIIGGCLYALIGARRKNTYSDELSYQC